MKKNLLILIFTIFICCKEDNPTESTNGNLTGIALDLNTDSPIQEVLVEVGDKSSLTDENGFYLIENSKPAQ